MAEVLTWHSIGVSLDGLIQNVIDSIAWKHINEKWPEFVIDTCNVKLGLALDGVNPFGDFVHAIQHGQLCYSITTCLLG